MHACTSTNAPWQKQSKVLFEMPGHSGDRCCAYRMRLYVPLFASVRDEQRGKKKSMTGRGRTMWTQKCLPSTTTASTNSASKRLVQLAGCQSVYSIFLSHYFSTHQSKFAASPPAIVISRTSTISTHKQRAACLTPKFMISFFFE
jgi:hypothetical protein